jgi:hypothetical protein
MYSNILKLILLKVKNADSVQSNMNKNFQSLQDSNPQSAIGVHIYLANLLCNEIYTRYTDDIQIFSND